jgi:hypothetical protein
MSGIRARFTHHHGGDAVEDEARVVEFEPGEPSRLFVAPRWLRDDANAADQDAVAAGT